MNVLPQDEKLAEKLWECSCIYLDRARVELIRNRLDEAERWVDEFQRCKRDLDKLIKRKEEHDRLVEMIHELQKRGINLAIIVGGKNK
ncbi:hypothetical protein [Bacillus alveayuensis]|uniref:hypothetical protein n=1 Tax=Aeribacillus alveayuensis TaxID=279215 RepID=UPI0005D11235|nr:hypothetical protein [Bacillus alveayuensis]